MSAGGKQLSNTARGVYSVIGFAFLTAVVNVYAGNVFQDLSPAVVGAISFALAGLLFTGLEVARRGSGVLDPIRRRPGDVVALNVTTAIAWLTVLFSLKYIEPAIVNVISLAVGPVFLALAGSRLRKGAAVVSGEIVAAVGIFALILVLTWGSITGRSAVGEIGHREAALGIVLALVSGLASAGNIVFSKRLSEGGNSPSSVMSVRFFLMIAVSWTFVAVTDQPHLADSVVPGIVLALISVIIPLYLLQVGVKHAEPITVSLLVCVGPAFAIALQLLDGRLTISPFSIVCVLGIVALVAWGVRARRVTARPAHPRPVVVVDAYSTGRYLPAALTELGADCIHVQSESPDVNLALDTTGLTENLRHHGDVAATAAALRPYGVSQVIAAAESGVELADQLSAALGTPGNGMKRPRSRRDKYEMVQALREAGLPHAATIVSDDADEVVAWAAGEASWPIVLKPVASAGTDNVVICGSPEEVRSACAKIMAGADRYGLANHVVLAQEFLAGDEYFVNTVSRDGQHRTAEIWRYFKRHLPGGNIIFDYHEPQSPDDPDAQRIAQYTHQVLDALEIRNGAGHSEVMLTSRGPVLVECAARLGGGQVPGINLRCLGTNQVDLLAMAAVEPDKFHRLPETAYRLIERPRHVSLINPRDSGFMPSYDAMAVIRELPSYAHTVLAHPEGQPLPRTIDVVTSPGFVYLISDDPDQIAADYARLRQLEQDGLYSRVPVR